MRRIGIVIGGVCLALALGAWLGRTWLMTWYCLHGLSTAAAGNCEGWVAWTVQLDQAAVPGLIDCLRSPNEGTCANAQAALVRLSNQWGRHDARSTALASRLAGEFGRLSFAGQQAVLDLTAGLLTDESEKLPTGLAEAAGRVLTAAGAASDGEVRTRALELVGRVGNDKTRPELLAACRDLVRLALQDREAGHRVQALQLAARPELGLTSAVVPLLHDESAQVRQAALLAVGSQEEAIDTDHLLRWLHDPDADVRRLCEAALRSRGLQGDDLVMGRLVSDPQAQVRLQVVNRLPRSVRLDPGVWLRHLTRDPEPAVRAAALRAAALHVDVDLGDRMEQMALSDPSPTVAQLARHYLSLRRDR